MLLDDLSRVVSSSLLLQLWNKVRNLRHILSRVPDETCAKGEGKLQDDVLRPLIASSPAVMALMLSMMFLSAGANACGGPRGDGSPLLSSIICTSLEETEVCPWEGCLLPVTTSNCMLCTSGSDCPEILCVNGDDDVGDGEGDVCELQSVRMANDLASG